jgi:hypothetical protein
MERVPVPFRDAPLDDLAIGGVQRFAIAIHLTLR